VDKTEFIRTDHLGIEPLGQHVGGEPVIAVAVGGEDVGESLASGLDPLADRVGLLSG